MGVRVAVVLALALLACKKDKAAPRPLVAPPHTVPVAWYRGALQAPDGELVFLLGLPDVHGGKAVLESGLDWVERDAKWDGTTLRIDFPVYQTVVIAERQPDGSLRGVFESRSRALGESSLRLIATPIARPELAALATVKDGAPLDLGARTLWKVALADDGIARLELEQVTPGNFRGTLEFTSGNHSFLAGNGKGDRVVLTSFDGAAPSRFVLALAPDRKTATGEWLSGQRLELREQLTAERVPALELASTQPFPRGAKLAMSQLAGLDGKPVIVELAGSWCSSCKNAAPVLRALYREQADSGLAIVTLLYEFTDDPAANQTQAAVFKRTYELPWKVVAMPGTPEDLADTLPKGFEKVSISGFPVALFLTREHTVAAVHAGFPVAGTPAYAQAVAAYRKNLALILDDD